MKLGEPINLEITLRHFDFSRQHAIRDVYDALVELITNSDDSYHRLYKRQLISEDGGSILIEIREQRNGENSLIVIYDRLEISATHDPIKRYLSPEPPYKGQEEPHFRVLLAEIIAESVCRKALELEVKTKPWDFKDEFTGSPEVIVTTVLTHLQRRMRDFVAIAHSIMLNVTDIK